MKIIIHTHEYLFQNETGSLATRHINSKLLI
jgi:hypothetical protein